MTEVVEGNRSFGDLILMEEFDHNGKTWLSYLIVPQEQLQDLFGAPKTIVPAEAYNRDKRFWNRISELTCDLYKGYLTTQAESPKGATRRQWFQWNDYSRLETAYRAFSANSNQPLRLSVVARDPIA